MKDILFTIYDYFLKRCKIDFTTVQFQMRHKCNFYTVLGADKENSARLISIAS